MTFEDSLEIRVLIYESTLAKVGKNTYLIKDGEISDESGLLFTGYRYDENGDEIEPDEEYIFFSKCFISFNHSAQKVRLNDGSEYIYSYYIIAPIRKAIYHLIPREGDWVHIRKADGTVDAKMEVKGFVTYKKRYLKIWL